MSEVSDEEIKKTLEIKLKMLTLFLLFMKKYNWTVVWNLERVLEDL